MKVEKCYVSSAHSLTQKELYPPDDLQEEVGCRIWMCVCEGTHTGNIQAQDSFIRQVMR